MIRAKGVLRKLRFTYYCPIYKTEYIREIESIDDIVFNDDGYDTHDAVEGILVVEINDCACHQNKGKHKVAIEIKREFY